MDKGLLILFFIIKIIIIIIVPVVLYIFRNKEVKLYIILESIALSIIVILYVVNYSYIIDSNITNILNINVLNESSEKTTSSLDSNIKESNITPEIEPIDSYRTHRNSKVYYYNGYEMPLSAKKVSCNSGYDYYKYYSDIMTSTAMLLSTYFNRTIDPIEIYNKVKENKLIKCGEPIDKTKFFAMITDEYKVNFFFILNSEFKNYILNGRVVMVETLGNGTLSCYESYFIAYDVNNSNEYLMLDPNNKTYRYICPEGSTGFGHILKANYNSLTFDYNTIFEDTNRLIVIGGTK